MAIFAQYTNSLLMLLHYCFPSIRGRANLSNLSQLYIWIEMANMLSNLFHRAFKVMCSDHFKCMCYWMCIVSSIQWWLNLKEWFRDFDEGGENQSCCILPSNRICGVVVSQFHFYPCDYTCHLFPLLQRILCSVAVWNRSINAMKECNCNLCEWVAFLAYHAFYDEVLVVHSVN